jgi:hypothetical protein
MLLEPPQRYIALAQTKFHADPSEVVDSIRQVRIGPELLEKLNACRRVIISSERRVHITFQEDEVGVV